MMNRKEIEQLQSIVEGRMYFEPIIDKAIMEAQRLKNLKIEELLARLKISADLSHSAFMSLQDFVCFLLERLNSSEEVFYCLDNPDNKPELDLPLSVATATAKTPLQIEIDDFDAFIDADIRK